MGDPTSKNFERISQYLEYTLFTFERSREARRSINRNTRNLQIQKIFEKAPFAIVNQESDRKKKKKKKKKEKKEKKLAPTRDT